MCRSKEINGEDISGVAEGKLSTQLVGNSPELQAMLGNGWSYAEGRYPIPLSLENDSMGHWWRQHLFSLLSKTKTTTTTWIALQKTLL